eukprot:scaffold7936_cov116-Isochrysis_galbana.AAC.4
MLVVRSTRVLARHRRHTACATKKTAQRQTRQSARRTRLTEGRRTKKRQPGNFYSGRRIPPLNAGASRPQAASEALMAPGLCPQKKNACERQRGVGRAGHPRARHARHQMLISRGHQREDWGRVTGERAERSMSYEAFDVEAAMRVPRSSCSSSGKAARSAPVAAVGEASGASLVLLLRRDRLPIAVRRRSPAAGADGQRPPLVGVVAAGPATLDASGAGAIARSELRDGLLLVVVLRLVVVALALRGAVLGALRVWLRGSAAGRHTLSGLLLPPLLGRELVAGGILWQVFRFRRERVGPEVVVVERIPCSDALGGVHREQLAKEVLGHGLERRELFVKARLIVPPGALRHRHVVVWLLRPARPDLFGWCAEQLKDQIELLVLVAARQNGLPQQKLRKDAAGRP